MLLKLSLFIILLVVSAINVFSQESESTSSENRFYKSIEDFAEGKYIEGIQVMGRPLGGSFSLKLSYIDQSGTNIEKRITELPADLFTYGGALYRVVGKELFFVLAYGKVNYYMDYLYNNVQYYSEGWDGKMKGLNSKWFENKLAEHNLLEAYKNDQPKMEKGETSNDQFNDRVARNIKYFNLLNEKLK